MIFAYGGSDLLYFHHILAPFYWDTKSHVHATLVLSTGPLISFINPKCSHVLALPFLFGIISKGSGRMILRNRHISWQWDDQFSKRGVKVTLRATILHVDKTWRQMKFVFIKTKQYCYLFQNIEQNGQRRTRQAFFNQGKKTTGNHLKLS